MGSPRFAKPPKYLCPNSLSERVLLAVWAGGPYSVHELAVLLGVNRQKVYYALWTLVHRGFVEHPSRARYLSTAQGDKWCEQNRRENLYVAA